MHRALQQHSSPLISRHQYVEHYVRRMPLDQLYNQFRLKTQGTNRTPQDKVNKKQINKREKGPGMLFGIDKWPSRDVREKDKAGPERDRFTNDHEGRMHSKIKESASYLT